MDWLDALGQLRRERLPAVLLTVLEVRGHAPRDAGAKMVVGTTGLWGSVGGGNLEITAVERARELLRGDLRGAPEVLEFGLSEHAADQRHGRQCCGGVVRLLIEPVPVRPTVAIFGLGHVGLELARVLSRHAVDLVLVDSRSEQVIAAAGLPAGPAGVDVRHEPAPEVVLAALPPEAVTLVLTHDHAEDLAICDMALRTPGLGEIGLIGSRAKWSRFRVALRDAGHTPERIDAIRCPIGVPDLEGKDPAVIAVSVAADLLRLLQPAPSTPSAHATPSTPSDSSEVAR